MSYATSYQGNAPQAALGELHRIGDIVMQELPNYESRRVCYIKAAQGKILKGQALGGDFTQGNAAGTGDLLALSNNDVQTIKFSADITTGNFAIRLVSNTGVECLTSKLGNANTASDIQLAINAALGQNANSVSVSGNAAAGASSTITLTFNGTGYTGRAFPLVKIDETEIPAGITSNVTRTNTCNPSCICLDQIANSAAVQQALCLVRTATVKPMYVSRDNSGTALTAGDKQALEMQSITVLGGPASYTTNPDTIDTANWASYSANTTLSTMPSAAVPGL
jgi:hypothetical protein